MPIPKPKPNEKPSDFMARCMSELTEFPNQKQRAAVCAKEWAEHQREPE